MTAIEVRGATVRFGATLALDGLDLSIPAGSFYGIAGPNGAGKTTLLRVISGLLRPTAGTVTLDETSVWPNPREAKTRLGYVPDNPALFERLTAREMLEYAGMLRRMSPDAIASRSADLLRVLDLEDDADRPLGDFSLGMTKRIGLAVAVLHSPRVLILDEPFGALDPVNTRVMEQLLHLFREGGGTVVFSSHVMDVVQRLCDRVAVVGAGRLLAEGTVPEIAGDGTLQDAFVRLVGGRDLAEGDLSWLSRSSV